MAKVRDTRGGQRNILKTDTPEVGNTKYQRQRHQRWATQNTKDRDTRGRQPKIPKIPKTETPEVGNTFRPSLG